MTSAPHSDSSDLPEGITGAEDWFLTDTAMRKLVAAGEAHPLSNVIVDFVRYRDTWWISYTDGWVANDQPGLNTRLDRVYRQARSGD